MKLAEHAASIAASAVITPAIISASDVPDTKEKLIGLVSAVFVQSLILGVTELRKYLSRRRASKKSITS